MMSNDAIHAQAEGGGDDNAESINTPEVDDYLCA
jgi:hypothetical protein